MREPFIPFERETRKPRPASPRKENRRDMPRATVRGRLPESEELGEVGRADLDPNGGTKPLWLKPK